MIERLPAGMATGKSDVRDIQKTLVLPGGAKRAQLRVELVKTYGKFTLDGVKFSRLNVQPIEQRVEKILLKSNAVGNLFLPAEKIDFQVTIEASSPLCPSSKVCGLRFATIGASSKFLPRKSRWRNYRGKTASLLTCGDHAAAQKIELGKYYELHAAVPQEIGEPVAEYCGFAILPVAASKEFTPEKIPFTIRNWDGRIADYFHLSDRLGLRMIGVWGNWSPEKPFKPEAPGIEIVQKLGAKWITTTPAADIEREGFKKYSEESLREGMENFLTKYADQGLAMIVQGNEPHGTGQKVFDNVRAYRAIYESVKAFDPKIEVIGTSVEPNEEYFVPAIKTISIPTTFISTSITRTSAAKCKRIVR